MIDKATADRIKEAADIVEVVSDYVHLTRRGSNYMGLCPFHNERTPSFSVNRRKNFCYCFSCHKGGSPVNFIMEKEGISYHDALLQLANKYGIKVEERELTEEERRAQSEREAMLVANDWAMQVFERNLHETEEGRNIGLQYFYQRGVTDEAIKKFHLGYAIDRGTALIDEAKKAGYDIEVLKKVGLVGTSREGRDYDRFRGRVIYPIMNSAGKVIAFGGRDLKGGPAKYINSPESEIYKKSNELYGIFQAKNAIGRNETCFLVEGYMDVIGMWQSGMENVLASSGTALTNGQIALIHRFAKEVILIYDGDAAGIKAALRGIDMLLAQRLRLKVLLLPDGDDPDSFARKHTPEDFRAYVEKNAVDVIKFKTQVLMSDAASDPVRRSEAIHSIVQSIANIPDKIQRITYIQQCANMLDMPDNVILQEAEKARVKVLENWKRDREKESIEREFAPRDEKTATAQTASQPDGRVSTTGQQPSEARQPAQSVAVMPQNAPFERELIRYCVRYGMAFLCSAADVDGNSIDMSVADYIAEELAYDRMQFEVATYSKMFDLILDMRDDFYNEYAEYDEKARETVRIEQQKGYDEIAAKNLSTTRIEVEEAHLQDRMDRYYAELIRDFIIDYPARKLASHEDDQIRKAVTQMISERVLLSRRFREMNSGQTEFDRISDLVPRALAEWRDGILQQQLNNLNNEIRVAINMGDRQLVCELQAKAYEIMQTRREAAKSIGDRIISTRR